MRKNWPENLGTRFEYKLPKYRFFFFFFASIKVSAYFFFSLLQSLHFFSQINNRTRDNFPSCKAVFSLVENWHRDDICFITEKAQLWCENKLELSCKRIFFHRVRVHLLSGIFLRNIAYCGSKRAIGIDLEIGIIEVLFLRGKWVN